MADKVEIAVVEVNDLRPCPEIAKARKIDAHAVTRYRQAMRNGHQFPPLTADSGSREIVDGLQRWTAYKEEYGPDHHVSVCFRHFGPLRNKLVNFVKANAGNALPLQQHTRKKLAARLLDLGLSRRYVENLFNVSHTVLERWGEEMVSIAGEPEDHVVVKRGVPGAIREITEDQYLEHEQRDLGVPVQGLVSQLLTYLTRGWCPKDENSTRLLQSLYEALGQELEKRKEHHG